MTNAAGKQPQGSSRSKFIIRRSIFDCSDRGGLRGFAETGSCSGRTGPGLGPPVNALGQEAVEQPGAEVGQHD